MKTKPVFVIICIITMLFLTSGGSAAPGATPLGTAFTYQGRLDRGGQSYTGTCDFQFSLWDAETDGLDIGSVINLNDLVVSNGLFIAKLDFGADAFNGNERWLEVVVQCTDDVSPTAFPRQEVTAAPYALYALGTPWSGLTGIPVGFADDRDDITGRSLPPTPTIITTLDSIGNDGYKPSITIGVDGLGLLSYYDTTDGDLKVAHCNNIECSSADISTLESDGDVGYYNSIAIGTDGLGLISYYDTSNGDLRVAHCDDIECNNATTYLLDSDGDMGSHNSITIGGDGLGLISYSSLSGPPKVAHCDNTNCSSATISLFDLSVAWGGFTSIVTGVDGLGLISYFTQLDYKLKVAHCDDALCSSVTITLIDTPMLSSITLGSDGLGLILVGTSGSLKVIHCGNIICDSSFPSYPGLVGFIGSITVGDNGLPLIVYRDSDETGLKVANCPNLTCNGSTSTMLDPDGGSYASATIGVDGLPLIVYRDSISYDLNVAHCSNMFCSSYLRRR